MKRLMRLYITVLLIVVGLFCNNAHALESYNIPITVIRDYDWANEALTATNEVRKEVNSKPLTMDSNLQEAAMKRAAEIAVHFDHTRPNGKLFYTAVSTPSASGENILYGYRTGNSGVMYGWKESPGHYKNMIKEDYKSVGIGAVAVEYSGSKTYFAVQMFSRYDAISTPNKTGKSDTMIEYVESIPEYIHDFNLYHSNYNGTTEHYYVGIGETLNIKNAYYISDEDTKATIDISNVKFNTLNSPYLSLKDGLIMGVKEGQTTFKASMFGMEKEFPIDVGYIMDSFSVNDMTVKINETKKISPTIVPSNATIYSVTYTSQSPEIAKIEDDKIVGVSKGSTTINVSGMSINKSFRASFKVKVEEDIRLKLNNTQYQFNSLNETLKLEATLSNGSKANDVTWKTDSDLVASVNNGVVTPKRGGFVRVTATSLKYGSASCLIYVSVPVTLSDGSKGYIGDVNKDGNINSIDSSMLQDYSISATFDEDINILGDINNNGYIDLEDITSILDIYNDNFFYTNGYKEIESVNLNKNNITLKIGGKDTVIATINPTDTTDSPTLTWKSDNVNVARVDGKGEITGIGNGTCTITVTTSNGKSAEATVKVGTGITPYLKGDLNENGKIEVIDAVEALYYALGKRELTNHKIEIGDFNNDQRVTAIDAVDILRLYMK